MEVSTSRLLRTPVPGLGGITTVDEQQRYARVRAVLWYLGALSFAGLLVAVLMLLGPTPAAIAWILLLTTIMTSLYNPRYGLYLVFGFALAADNIMVIWYPALKNLSSVESLLFLHDAAIINPTEIVLVTIFLSWLVRGLVTRRLNFVAGHLLLPVLLFLAFVTFGFMFGMYRGGDLNIALWTARGIFYLPLVLVLTSNLITTRDHVRHLIWSVMIAMAVNGIQGTYVVAVDLQWDIKSVLEIGEHPLSVDLNSMFLLFGVLMYVKGSPRMRWFLLVTMPFMLIAYYGNQRRAGYVAIAVAVLVFALLAHWYHRRTLWLALPILSLVLGAYLAVFWNSTSPPAFLAQEVRAIIAPIEGSEEQSSSQYRQLENANILFTIKQMPLTGVGFGNKFIIVYQMADISFFAWWEYITHNQMLWIWMQAGAGGFLSMLFFIGTGISLGMRRLFAIPRDDMWAVTFVAVTYIFMYAVYAYVDVAWDGQSMIYLGVLLGLINVMDRIVARPVPAPVQRWPWQRRHEVSHSLQRA